MTEMDDEKLLALLLQGDQAAFRHLVSRYQGAMRAVAVAIVGNRLADEVVQDSWVAVVRHLNGFAGRSSLKTWLITITANTAKTRLKTQRRQVPLAEGRAPHGSVDDDRFVEDGHWRDAPASWHSDSPEALLSEEQLAECLEHTLASLSELQRGVLILRERQGVELSEICNLLDISLSNARVLLHRARLSVFATLEHYEVTGEC
tara:strand:- start:11054 stop:11665 length:612 start_codon:yes stop_codon:yes gene_type:complete